MEDFECGPDSVLTDSIDTSEQHTSLDDADAIPSSGFFHLVSTVSDTSRPQLGPSLKFLSSYGTQARALL